MWCNYIFLIFLAISTPLSVIFLNSFNYYWDYVEFQFSGETGNQVYDFIVVGSGSAGAVVSTRLSKNYKVLLLEAGGHPVFWNNVPVLAMDMLGYASDWRYKTVPQKHSCKGMNNQQSSWNRGKVLGGSSTANFMLYLRGHPNDFDNWANITGDPEWKFDNVLPFFKKSIKEYRGRYQDNKKHYEPSSYGFLTIEEMSFIPLRKEFKEAGKDLGYDEIDVNGPQRSGFGDVEVNQKDGARAGTYAALLKHPWHPNNLKISKYSQAVKIHIDKSGRAVGVWYVQHGVKKYASAKKEVISSAGSVDSPKLLLLSGIGPEKDLRKLGIKTKANLPVGRNLQDHVCTSLFPITINETSSFLLERNTTLSGFLDYYQNGKGPLTTPVMMNTQAFISSSLVDKKLSGDWPDLQFFFHALGTSEGVATQFTNGLNYRDGFVSQMIQGNDLKDGIHIVVILGRPKTRGYLTLKDKNPFSDPLIDPMYYEEPEDSKRVIEGIKIATKLVEETNTFKRLGAIFSNTPMEDCKSHEYRSDAYWNCYIRHNTLTVWHPVGTCAMGKGKSDKNAVLDSKLRVLGITGLRVIDASIMPKLINANTNAASIMIGEKGAHFILDYWASQFLVCDRVQHFMYLDASKCFYSRRV